MKKNNSVHSFLSLDTLERPLANSPGNDHKLKQTVLCYEYPTTIRVTIQKLPSSGSLLLFWSCLTISVATEDDNNTNAAGGIYSDKFLFYCET